MTRHNLCPNPAVSVNNTGWGGGSTPARITGLTGFPVTTGAHYTSGTFMQLPTGAASPGLQYTGSVYVRPNGAGIGGGTFYLAFTRSSGGDDFSHTVAIPSIPADTVVRLDLTATSLANTTGVYIILDGINSGAIPGGTHVTACLLEQATLDDYFDGDVPGPPTSSWDGTTGLSPSTLEDAPPLIEGDVAVDLGALTIGAVGTTIVNGSVSVALGALTVASVGRTRVDGVVAAPLGGLGVAAIGSVQVNGGATVALGGLNVAAVGQRTAVGLATVNLGQLAISASAITGGPVVLPDDFYSPGPCRDYEYISFCTIPVEAVAVSGYAVTAASEILYYASGQRFDTCQVTIRPCRKECSGDAWPRLSAGWWEFGGGPVPALINGLWYNIACGFCGTNCSCSIVSETILPGPVREISQVTVDGVVLDPTTDYRLDDYRKLVRLGGELWPLCNNLNLGITEEGTWSVTAIYGEPLPTLGKFAMGQLLCQIIADVLGEDCALPDNVTNITRQGLSFTLEEVEELVQSGFTGLKYVDQFIQRYNPNKLMARARLYDVDAPDFRVTGTSF